MHVIANPFDLIFLLSPPILLLWKRRGLNYSEASILLFFCIWGWLCLVFGLEYYYDRLSEQIQSTPNPPQELVERLTQDAGRIGVYMFGWLYSSIYFHLWLLIRQISFWLWRVFARFRRR
jgi:hypothetical protein